MVKWFLKGLTWLGGLAIVLVILNAIKTAGRKEALLETMQNAASFVSARKNKVAGLRKKLNPLSALNKAMSHRRMRRRK